jgi:hypothetical protein
MLCALQEELMSLLLLPLLLLLVGVVLLLVAVMKMLLLSVLLVPLLLVALLLVALLLVVAVSSELAPRGWHPQREYCGHPPHGCALSCCCLQDTLRKWQQREVEGVGK